MSLGMPALPIIPTFQPPLPSLVTAVANLQPDAWSVTSNSQELTSTLFAASLIPYLAFLWFLSRAETKTPTLANFGFQFLLVFVFATIPAGIIAKSQYNDILANVDFLHGGAEALLSVTNLLIIAGFRKARPEPAESSAFPSKPSSMLDFSLPLLVPLVLLPGIHTEPSNALSIPTWIVHSSSLLEWLVAMKLVWEHASISGNPRWRGLALGMIPSHTSGLCAVTYHFFYNSPELSPIVALQALLTCVGNSTLALAAYRIYQQGKAETANAENGALPNEKTLPLMETNAEFSLDLVVKSILLAFAVKYGSLFLDLPFEPSLTAALGIILLGTTRNVLSYAKRSVELNMPSTKLL